MDTVITFEEIFQINTLIIVNINYVIDNIL